MKKTPVKWLALGLCLLPLLGAGSCRVKTTERLPPEEVLPLQTATLEELVARLERQAAAVTSINAETELRPTTGSAYSGVIEQYHDVKAFVLGERRTSASGGNRRHIRVLGQAPILRKNIFDMVADEEQFRIYLPTKNKFIVGPTRLEQRSEKPIENLRPQHLFEAIFLEAPAPEAMLLLEENEWGGRRYYALTELVRGSEGRPVLRRHWWFERSRLELVRVQRFDAEGRLLADIHYGQWREVDGIAYPHDIELVRPQEDYRLRIIVKKLTLNEPVPASRFRLERPEGVELVELKEAEPSPGEGR